VKQGWVDKISAIEFEAFITKSLSRMNYRPRMPRNSKENQASALIHCRAEFSLFVQHELPPLPPRKE
jgi:hypothetical protein